MNKKRLLLRLSSFAGLCLGGLYLLVSNRQVKETYYDVYCNKLPDAFEGKKILLLSDLHKKRYGDNFDNLINSVQVCQPDYIFFAGDLYSKDETDMRPKIYFMKRLRQIAPVYYIPGNHEIRRIKLFESLCNELSDNGIIVLRNAHTKIYSKKDYVNIYGTQLPISCYVNRDGGYNNLREVSVNMLDKLLGKTNKNECNLLLSHNPFFFENYAKWGADMVFSGHCHGGAIRIPFIGGLFSPERKFFPKYTKGIYHFGNSQMILTVGLGKFRLNNPSEIVIITLKNK